VFIANGGIMQKLFVVWGETAQQRWLDRGLAWVRDQFGQIGYAYPEEHIAQIVTSLREDCDESGMRKLFYDCIRAVLFIRTIHLLGGWATFDHLNAELEAGRLPKRKGILHILAAVRFFVGYHVAFVRQYVNRIVGTTWYERSLTTPLIIGVAFTAYVLYASTAFVDAKAFMHPAGYMEPQTELAQLSKDIPEKLQKLNDNRDAVTRAELLDSLHDCWRWYKLASEVGTPEQVVEAVLSIEQIETLITWKERAVIIRPGPKLPQGKRYTV
jgi:hypothetical protein